MAADHNRCPDSSDEEIISPRHRRLNSAKKRRRFQDSDDDSIISYDYLNLSLADEHVGDVTIPTQVIDYNKNFLQAD
jgi:hypothetical protein